MKTKKSIFIKKHKVAIIVAAALLVVTMSILLFVLFHQNKPVSNTSQTTNSNNSSTTDSTTHTQSASSGSQGGAIDTGGTTTVTDAPQAGWTAATSGNIVVHSPANNSLLSTGDTIYGTALTDIVNYKLVDNDSGVIAQGQLSVVNGTFSGILMFRPSSNAGILKIFSYNQSTGAEENRVEITVRF